LVFFHSLGCLWLHHIWRIIEPDVVAWNYFDIDWNCLGGEKMNTDARQYLKSLLNKNMKIKLTDGRVLIG
jgi:hypothetical protein